MRGGRRILCCLGVALAAAVAALASAPASAEPTARKLRVFLFAGQSNMEGKGDGSRLTAAERERLARVQPRIRLAYNRAPVQPLDAIPASEGNRRRFGVESTFGPELFFGLQLAEAWPEERFLFIKRSVGATSLYGRWNPDWSAEKAARLGEDKAEPLYPDFVAYVREVLAGHAPDTYEICGLVWVQGEKDGNVNLGGPVPGQEYGRNLENLVAHVRRDVGVADLPFVLLEVGSDPVVAGMRRTAATVHHVTLVPQSRRPSSPYFYPKHEVGHYNYEGMKRIGTHLADAYLADYGPLVRGVPYVAPRPPPDRTVVFRSTPERELRARIYLPDDWSPADRRPAIVFWCGGAFRGGSADQFLAQARYFASRGLVAVHADYRGTQVDGVPLMRCVEDGRSALRWLRSRAAELGIDPDRIVAAGGSAGGSLALLTVPAGAGDAPAEPADVPSRPAALVLFNPAMGVPLLRAVDPPQPGEEHVRAQLRALARPMAGSPPAVMFFGTRDTDYLAEARAYAEAARAQGDRCDLLLADGQDHGFFNRPPWRGATLRAADAFLVSLGYLGGDPALPVDPGARLSLAGP